MIKTVQEHWKILFLIFIVAILGVRANSLIDFIIKRSQTLPIVPIVHAQTAQPTVRFDVSAGKYAIGDVITVAVLLSSPSQSVNAVTGEIAFPTDKLKLLDISTKDSIIRLWVPTDPYFSATTNTIVFSGGIPNPAFSAVDGNILTLTFEAIAPGNTEMGMKNLVVLANDGAGTALDTTAQSLDLILRDNPLIKGSTHTIGDINHDGVTNLSDLSILIGNWGTPKNPDADLDGDGSVNMKDLSILFSKIPSKSP